VIHDIFESWKKLAQSKQTSFNSAFYSNMKESWEARLRKEDDVASLDKQVEALSDLVLEYLLKFRAAQQVVGKFGTHDLLPSNKREEGTWK
jgi:hypothetical protein